MQPSPRRPRPTGSHASKLVSATQRLQKILARWGIASRRQAEIMMREKIPEIANWRLRIVCTDINEEMVERTRNGLYTTLEVNRGLPAAMLL